MVPALRSEFRKLLSVRSTYLLSLLIIVLTCLFTYFGTSSEYVNKEAPSSTPATSQSQSSAKSNDKKDVISQTTPDNGPPQKTNNLQKDKLASNIINTTGAAVFIAVVVVLLMAHEFRYNTITYTLTLSKSRSRVLLAKIVVGTTYIVAVSLLAMAVTVAVTYLAVNIKGLNLPPQDINWLYINARLIGYILWFALFG